MKGTLTVGQLIEMLSEDTNPNNRVCFDVKSVDQCQDFASLQEIYWDGDLVLVFK